MPNSKIPTVGGIVKVQASIVGAPNVLVYNRERTIMQQFPQTPEVMKAMNGDLKKFFYYHLDPETKKLILDEEAPWQQW